MNINSFVKWRTKQIVFFRGILEKIWILLLIGTLWHLRFVPPSPPSPACPLPRNQPPVVVRRSCGDMEYAHPQPWQRCSTVQSLWLWGVALLTYQCQVDDTASPLEHNNNGFYTYTVILDRHSKKEIQQRASNQIHHPQNAPSIQNMHRSPIPLLSQLCIQLCRQGNVSPRSCTDTARLGDHWVFDVCLF